MHYDVPLYTANRPSTPPITISAKHGGWVTQYARERPGVQGGVSDTRDHNIAGLARHWHTAVVVVCAALRVRAAIATADALKNDRSTLTPW